MGIVASTFTAVKVAPAIMRQMILHDDEEDNGYGSECRRTPLPTDTPTLDNNDDELGEGWRSDGVDLFKVGNEVMVSRSVSGLLILLNNPSVVATRIGYRNSPCCCQHSSNAPHGWSMVVATSVVYRKPPHIGRALLVYDLATPVRYLEYCPNHIESTC